MLPRGLTFEVRADAVGDAEGARSRRRDAVSDGAGECGWRSWDRVRKGDETARRVGGEAQQR